MPMPILLVLMALITPAIYVLFFNPKPSNWRELGRYSTSFKSGLFQDDCPSEAEIFQTLKDADIESCFLATEF
jgi:hypothetical protein